MTFQLGYSVSQSVLAALHYNITQVSVIPDRLVMMWKTGLVANFMWQEMTYQVILDGEFLPASSFPKHRSGT